MNENEELGHMAASHERITNAFDDSSNDTNSWEAEAPEMSIRTRQVVSIAHDDIVAGRIRYVHVDIQYSQGDSKIQISAVVLGTYHNEVGKFNEFASPDCDGPLSTSMPIDEVWARFVQFVETNIGRDRAGMLLAWGGEASKFFHFIDVKCGALLLGMPRGLKYFCDP
eukprot:scaffold13624_cov38-Cyclotella_meneghiniana.AAC.1